MEKRFLGKSGLEVSRLCFGSLTVGPLQLNMSPAEGGRVVRTAVEGGVNFIDTAQIYGSYDHIREGLSGFDGHVIISSKTYAYTKDMALAAVEEARQKLNRDVIDIFMIHETESIHTLRGHMEALDELYRLKALGVIRAVGTSTHHVAGVDGAIELGLDVLHPLINHTGLGIVDGSREQMEDACVRAHEAGIGIFTMKPLGGGNFFKDAETALNYALDCVFADSVAIGMRTPDEVRSNIAFVQSRQFLSDYCISDKDKRQIRIEYWCDGCGKCIEACTSKALELQGERMFCHHSECILCGYCSAKCPNFAIKII